MMEREKQGMLGAIWYSQWLAAVMLIGILVSVGYFFVRNSVAKAQKEKVVKQALELQDLMDAAVNALEQETSGNGLLKEEVAAANLAERCAPLGKFHHEGKQFSCRLLTDSRGTEGILSAIAEGQLPALEVCLAEDPKICTLAAVLHGVSER